MTTTLGRSKSRTHRLARLAVAVGTLALGGCEDTASTPASPPQRFAGVAKQPLNTQELAKFCDKSFSATGANAPVYQPAPTRPLEGAPALEKREGWRWINAWATWCTPCVEEMGLLTRWREALQKDGVSVGFELLSIDTPDAEPKLKTWLKRNLPGQVQWLRSEEAFGPWLDSLGIDRNAAIPIHALVDPHGRLRCVRVGAVHEQDYGAIRALLTAS